MDELKALHKKKEELQIRLEQAENRMDLAMAADIRYGERSLRLLSDRDKFQPRSVSTSADRACDSANTWGSACHSRALEVCTLQPEHMHSPTPTAGALAELEETLKAKQAEAAKADRMLSDTVGPEEIAQVVSKWTGEHEGRGLLLEPL